MTSTALLPYRFLRCRRGVAAVEFALVTPVFVLLLFGIISASVLMMTFSGVQQLVAESARATVGGLTDTERDQLARSFVSAHVSAYPFLDASKLTVTTAVVAPGSSFQVTLTYDASASITASLATIVPLVRPTITRSAVVQQGGT